MSKIIPFPSSAKVPVSLNAETMRRLQDLADAAGLSVGELLPSLIESDGFKYWVAAQAQAAERQRIPVSSRRH